MKVTERDREVGRGKERGSVAGREGGERQPGCGTHSTLSGCGKGVLNFFLPSHQMSSPVKQCRHPSFFPKWRGMIFER
jgi:hypothetical protein